MRGKGHGESDFKKDAVSENNFWVGIRVKEILKQTDGQTVRDKITAQT